MASSDDVTSEKSNIFADEISDPDLEARLYAEIYYSNETYEPEAEGTKENDPAACIVPSLTALSLSSSNALDETALRNKDDRSIDNLFNNNTPREAPQTRVPSFARPYYSARNWTLGKSHDSNTTIQLSDTRQKVFKKCRSLTREGLWLQHEIPKDPPPPLQKRFIRISPRLAQLKLNNAQRETEQNHSNDRKTREERAPVPISNNSRKQPRELTKKQKKREDKQKTKERAKKLEKLLKKSFQGTTKLRRHKDVVNSMGVTTETSKYKVVSKKQKLNMKTKDSVEISSDSDDSILEVPIPPKVPPPLIQLPDSDDESEQTSGPPSGDNFTPCYVLDTDGSLSSESSDSPARESPNPLNEVDDESSNDCETSTGNVETISNVEKTPLETDNIVLNCTDVQRGASSLEEIRKIRENEMSEEETTNWLNIAVNRASTSRENNEREIDGNVDKPPKTLWEQLIEENSASTSRSNENSMLGSFASPSAETVAPDITENEPNLSTIENDEETNEKTTRKRQNNDEPDEFTNFNVPDIPEKRVKGKTVLSSRDLSLTDYFFKPMSSELQAFYNNPWGGENLDVCDIQSRMPRNPKCWAILDADLRTSPKKRGRRCQRCQTDSHFGKNCPLKSKVPNCCICGVSGHLETRCPQTMCLTCGQKYATFRPTCERCSNFYCNMCNGTGHTRENCPDLWRRYHNTTTELAPVSPKNLRKVMKPQQALSCCNCAKRGHDETTCRKLRWSQHFPTPMHIISYTDGPNYSSGNHEFAREIEPSENIEIVDIPDDDILLLEPDDSTTQEKLLFQCFNITDSTGSETITSRLDTLKNADLRGFVAGRLLPTFLHTWQKNFTFNFRVIRNPDRQIILIIETNCKKLLVGLEKIFIQWITRRDDEKPLLIYDALPFENVREMKTELERKISNLDTSSEPNDILNDIAVFEAKILNINWESRINGIANKRLKNMRQDRKMLRIAIPSARCALITSLYNRSMIDGGDNTVSAFRTLVNRFRGSRDGLPVEDYMEIVYLYNEIFIFHKSDAVSEAISRLSKPKMTTRSARRRKALQNSNITDVREANSVKPNTAESDDRQSETKQLSETNDAESNQPSTVDSNTAEISSNLEIKKVSDIDLKNDEVIDLHDYRNVTSTPRPLSSDAFLEKKTRKFSQNPNHAKIKQKLLKKGKREKGLLINLSKEKQDHFKRIANEVIRLANLTENPNLHKEAKTLMYKMTYDMVRKRDIDLLQQRLNRNKRRELEKNRTRKPSNADFLSL